MKINQCVDILTSHCVVITKILHLALGERDARKEAMMSKSIMKEAPWTRFSWDVSTEWTCVQKVEAFQQRHVIRNEEENRCKWDID